MILTSKLLIRNVSCVSVECLHKYRDKLKYLSPSKLSGLIEAGKIEEPEQMGFKVSMLQDQTQKKEIDEIKLDSARARYLARKNASIST